MRVLGNIYAVALIFAAVTMAIYGVALNNDFVLDDELQIVNNEVIRSPSNIGIFFSASTFNQESPHAMGGIYFKPLMSLAYSILWWLSPEQTLQFHLWQLLLIAANALLIFLLFRKLLSESTAFVCAVIFLVHPLHTETAVYIADLQDVMFSFFGLLALNFLARWKTMGFRQVVVLFLLLTGSLLSKESGILYLATAVAYVALFRRELMKSALAAGGATLAFYLWLRLGVAHLNQLTYAMNKIGAAPLSVRLLTAPLTLALYIGKFIYPANLSSTQDWIVETPSFVEFWFPLALMLGILGAAGSLSWRRGSKFTFFTLWVVMGLGLHSHIVVPLDGTFADRWFYFPCVGLLGLLALAYEEWLLPRHRSLAAGVAGVLVVAFALRSFVRAQDWKDQLTLCTHDLQISPDAYDLHNCVGVELFRRGQVREAKAEFERSTELKPQWDVNWNNLGAAYNHLGDIERAKQNYLQAIQNGPYFMAYHNYASLLAAEGHTREARTFIEEKALPRFPASAALIQLYQSLPP